MPQCHFCGAAMNLGEPIGREATCDSCGRDLRCCKQCRHYDPHYNNECRETMADPVVEKDRRNFCEYFHFSAEPFRAGAPATDRAAAARTKLESLFNPGAQPKAKEDARAKLESLFKKPPKPEADE